MPCDMSTHDAMPPAPCAAVLKGVLLAQAGAVQAGNENST